MALKVLADTALRAAHNMRPDSAVSDCFSMSVFGGWLDIAVCSQEHLQQV